MIRIKIKLDRIKQYSYDKRRDVLVIGDNMEIHPAMPDIRVIKIPGLRRLAVIKS